MTDSHKGWRCVLAPVPLRLAMGAIFTAHGCQKVFVKGTAALTETFAQMGIALPHISAPLVAYTEFVGGLFLMVGLLTPLASLMLACTMAVAVLKVHLGAGLTGPGGFEFPLSLLAGCLTLLISGPGSLSLDKLLFCRRKCSK